VRTSPDTTSPRRLSRRAFLWTLLGSGLSAVLAACGLRERAATPTTVGLTGSPTPPAGTAATAPTTESATAPATSAPQALAPTPACGSDDAPTPPQTEGPFFTPNSPERTSLLEPDMTGSVMTLTGTVLGTDCQPVAGALLDFWHADDQGQYDNTGFRLRGHQFADEQGRFSLETIVPGLYPGRTRHFHVKVQAPNGPVLTTQLYFPDEPGNQTDRLFDADLLMDMPGGASGSAATFDFVLG
jgi:protocatechuate 3,4-dioxygenase beta subunit